MKRALPLLAIVLGIVVFLASPGGTRQNQAAFARTSGALSTAPVAVDPDFGKIPLQFIPNRGQTDGQVDYYVPGRDKTIYFTPEGLTFVLGDTARRWVVKLDFLDANRDVEPESLERSGAVVSYFKGRPEDWTTGLPACSKLIYRDLWPGIDLVFRGAVDRLKYEFIVHPGADPARIKLAYRGPERLTLTEEGRLEVSTPLGGFQDDIPMAWQEIGGEKAPVEIAYRLEERPAAGAERSPAEDRTFAYGFQLGDYDRSRPLVLDPAVLVYCGYLGGTAVDYGIGIAVDTSGYAYVTGYTWSSEASFPVTAGPSISQNGWADAFVAKISPDGTSLVYCGFIGGLWDDVGARIAVDNAGNAYIAGYAYSTEATFPVTVGPGLTHKGGGADAFVAKINADGTSLLYCGYIGGSGEDYGIGIAIDDLGSAYISGYTFSTEASFPVTAGPGLTHNGDSDAFVAKVSADGTTLEYCGYIGGSAYEESGLIAVDDSGNAYMTGFALSKEGTFPVTVGPDLTHNGAWDAFVAKVSADGTSLLYCGYIGGEDYDGGYGIAVDDSGCAYVSGYASSTETTFPVVRGPDLTHNGLYDAFVAKVNADGASLAYCGFIGGVDYDTGYGIAVDVSGMAYLTGYTESTEQTFPVAVGPDLTYNGMDDAFLAQVSPSGTGLVSCGYVGGSEPDYGISIAVGSAGNVYLVGYTASAESTFPVTAGPGLTHGGDSDAFVARISAPDVPPPILASLLPSSATAGDPDFLLSVVGADFADGAVVRWDGDDRPTTFVNRFKVDAEIAAADIASGKIVQVTVRNPDDGLSEALEFTVNNPLPALTSLSPARATAGGAAFTLTVLGSNFVPTSVARWNGNAKTTTYVSATELQASIAAVDIAAGGEAQVTVANPTPGGGTSGAVTFPVTTFTMGSSPTSATVTAGGSATYSIQVTPQFGSFDAAVSLSCTGLPTGCTATFSPASVTPGTNPVTSTLTLATTARSNSGIGAARGNAGLIPPALGLFILVSALCFGLRSGKAVPRRPIRRRLTAGGLACLLVLLSGCSAGGDGNTPGTGTPAGTYRVSVTGASGSLAVSTTVTLVVR